MARKPHAELSPAYRRRIERAEARGKTRQQARGKRAGEHVIRRERERARAETLGTLTSQQRAAVRAFAKRQAARMNGQDADASEVMAQMLDWAGSHGYQIFARLRDLANAAHRQYLKEMRDGTYVSRGIGLLELWAEDLDTPDARWLYYH